MKRIISGLMSMLILAAGLSFGSASAESGTEVFTWTDQNTGNTYVDEFNYATGTVTTTVIGADGTQTVQTVSIDTGTSSGTSGSNGTVQNADGSITVVSNDQTGAAESAESAKKNASEGTASSSTGLTQEEWEARMEKAIAANGTQTETFYKDENGTNWPVEVEYIGLGRSSIILNGEKMLVPTSSLNWASKAPADKLLAVVSTTKQSYLTLRSKKSQKAFVMDHCEKCRVLRVLSTGKTWTMVDSNGLRGYVLTNGLTFYSNEPRNYITGLITFRGKVKSANTVHVRSGNKSSARQLEEFPCGTPLTIFSGDGKWYEVDVGGWHCYILSEFVTLDEGMVLASLDQKTAEP